jgi:VWFA-related protein
MRRALPALLFCLSVLVVVAAQIPSTPQPTFRTGVRVVEIDAVVRDDDDNFVTGLTKDDFEVLEDGAPQEIAGLTMLNLAAGREAPAAAAVGPALTSAASLDDIGRVYVMILNAGDPVRLKALARQFIEEFVGPTDLMAVINGSQAATPGLTSDRETLLAAVDRFAGGRGNGLEILKDATVNLTAVRGRRKAILFFQNDSVIGAAWWRGEGSLAGNIDTEANRKARRDWDDIARTAVRNNVRIYPIDPNGFRVQFGDMTNSESSRSPEISIGEIYGLAGIRASRIMAADTGAIAIVNTGNFDGNFRRIVRDNSAYYVVAFYSSAPDDGREHRVQVRVKGRPELSVRSRSGYRAPAPDVKGRSVRLPKNLSVAAKGALTASPTGTSGLPIELFTAVFRGEDFDGSVVLGAHVPGHGLNLASKERIELSYAAVDRWGTTRAVDRRAFTLTFSEAVRARVAQTGVRLFGRLRLPRGRYEIRAAVHQPGGGTGSAIAQVEIPDYSVLPMSVSDLVVASSRSPSLLTLEDDAVLRRALATQPTPRRRFAPSETLSVFGEIYNAQWVLTQQLGVSTIVRAADGRVVGRSEDTIGAVERGRAYFNGKIPLDRLSPGEYVMTLEAYSRNGIPASASQELRFEVADE